MTRWIYAPLDSELITATFGEDAEGPVIARRVTYAQRHAIRWAYEAWRRHEVEVTSGPKRPLVAWGEDDDGIRWPLDDPRFMPTERVGSGGTYPVPRCGQVGKPSGKVYSYVKGITPCGRRAGERTDHYGAGPCWRHRGNTTAGRLRGAYVLAHAFARELDCSPWEALLRAVRIAAGKVAYCEWVMSQASSDLELEGRFGRSEDGLLLHPDTGEVLGGGQVRNLAFWVAKSELWTDRLARYGKMAIDAGVAERLVQQVEVEGQAVGRVLSAALGELEGEVPDELVARVRGVMRRELLALEAESGSGQVSRTSDADARVVDSTYVDDEETRE